MKTILKLFLLITAFALPCGLHAMEEVSFSIEEPTGIKKEFNEFAELFTTATTFDAIKAKLEASPDKKALVTYRESTLVAEEKSESLLHLLIFSELADDIKIETVKLFVKEGADINAKLDDTGLTILHHAIMNDWPLNEIEYLLKKGADVNAFKGKAPSEINPTPDSLTPLFIAVLNQKDDPIKLLLEYDADPSIQCCYIDKMQTAQERYKENYPSNNNADSLFATQPDPEKIKLIERPKSSENSSLITPGKVGLTTIILIAAATGAYYLYKKYQDKKKRDQENQKKKADQEKIEKLEKLEKEMIEQAPVLV